MSDALSRFVNFATFFLTEEKIFLGVTICTWHFGCMLIKTAMKTEVYRKGSFTLLATTRTT